MHLKSSSVPGGADASAQLGVVGAGNMGVRLARMFARAGRRVVLGTRDPQRALARLQGELPPTLTIGTPAQAFAAQAVLPTVFLRDGLVALLAEHRAALASKVLIDISNPFNQDYSDYILPWDTSSAEVLQQALPEVRVVGAFKNVFAEVFDRPDFGAASASVLSDVLVVGDDQDAKSVFLSLAQGTPFRYLDAGPLRNARTLERLTLITGRLGRQLGTYPRMNWRLLGESA
ncbi:NADPH-dependent F420 reductase [Agrilutibacter solisilvae]|uniref:NAD(P)-binding domain-containing protein n=1 Tax=Agrilutibacter solisilvae TaxID=2763317 RepID=A0A974XW29_9GAMM|nr:NAD(P)-binding domain-containing protein [Lysobacter solisilvae]QSX76961.1 NAD(P)-binding domain-containing protein [Lysobacter solisilvae]